MLRQGGESEVGDLEVTSGVEEEILRLEVAVGDAVTVAESESGDQLLEVAASCILRELPTAGDGGEEFAASGELNDEVDLGFRRHDLVDAEDVGVVVEAAHGVDLTDYTRFHGGVNGLRFVDDFDGDDGAVDEGAGLVDLREASAAEEADDLVFAEDGRSGGGTRRRWLSHWWFQIGRAHV